MAMPVRSPHHVANDSGLLPARAWIVEEAGHLHPGFASPSQFDEQRARFTPKKAIATNVLQSHTDHFLQVMELYKSSTKDPAIRDLDIGATHTWDEVIRSARDAENVYVDSAKGLGGLHRKVGRWAGDSAPAATPWLKCLPNGDYTSILSSGLLLVFGAAARMSEKRQQILDALGDVPVTIQTAEHCQESFPGDQSLKDETTELYLTILIAIEGMMKWFVAKGGWKHIKAILQGPRYETKLEDKIKDVKEQQRSLLRRVDVLRDSAIARTYSTTRSIEPRVEQVDLRTKDIKAGTDATLRSVNELQDGMNNVYLGVDNVTSKVSTVIETTSTLREAQDANTLMVGTKLEKIQSGVDAQNGLLVVLQEQFRKAEWNQKKLQEAETKIQLLTVELERARTPNNQQGIAFTPSQLLDLLAVDPARSSVDIDITLRQGRCLNPSSHARGHLLMQHPKFQTWLTSGQSASLLVNGNASTALERTSAMSFVSALLSQSLADQSAACIHFFCGLHTARNDSLSGPRGLLKTLLAQIVYTHNFDLSFVDEYEYRQLQSNNIGALSRLLERLIQQLPTKLVLFCIIDGISFYENAEWVEEACSAMNTLNKLTMNPQLNAVFKLLVTSPLASRYIREHIPQENQVTLVQDSSVGARHFLTERQMQTHNRRPMDSSARMPSQELHPSNNNEIDEGFDESEFDEGNLKHGEV